MLVCGLVAMVTVSLKGVVRRCYECRHVSVSSEVSSSGSCCGHKGFSVRLARIFGPLTHHDRFGQLALRADGVERPAEQPSSRRQRQLVQVRRGSSPERPGDERAPPFEGLLGEVCRARAGDWISGMSAAKRLAGQRLTCVLRRRLGRPRLQNELTLVVPAQLLRLRVPVPASSLRLRPPHMAHVDAEGELMT